ncbi:hypothetical protein Tco_0180406 [Tanacetum coccineum]
MNELMLNYLPKSRFGPLHGKLDLQATYRCVLDVVHHSRLFLVVPDELTIGSLAKVKHDIVIDWCFEDESDKSEQKISEEEEENKDDDDDDDRDKSNNLKKTDDEDDDEYDERVMDDTGKINQKKVEDEGDADLDTTRYEQGLDDQAQDDQVGELLKTIRKEKSDFPLSSTSKSTSSNLESLKGKTLPKSSKTRKSVHAEETVEEDTHEVAMDVEEPTLKNA